MTRDHVLVIDDDDYFRELVALVLVDDGLVCIEARDCAAALPLLERERGRLRAVLLDYFMPGLEPRACIREILARIDSGVRVVLVSAAVDIGERAAELGLDRFLSKPFDLTQLHAAVMDAPDP
jgi:DNA-binding response OmpR family regulator